MKERRFEKIVTADLCERDCFSQETKSASITSYLIEESQSKKTILYYSHLITAIVIQKLDSRILFQLPLKKKINCLQFLVV